MKQPTLEQRKEYNDIVNNSVSIVPIKGTKRSVKLRWMHPYTIERITQVWVERELASVKIKDGASVAEDLCKEPYFAFKEAALMILNNDIKIRLFYGFLWRWLAFRYSEPQIVDVIAEGKKKISSYGTLQSFSVLSGYNDGYDDDDKEGSRAVPSRTSLGREAAFVKDFPEYGRPRWRLFRWERDFGYRCVLTCAQIEIMQADLPHTLYLKNKRKSKKKDNDNYQYNPNDPAIEKTMESIRRRKERMAQEQGFTTEELFKK